jgi:hypothetical protein
MSFLAKVEMFGKVNRLSAFSYFLVNDVAKKVRVGFINILRMKRCKNTKGCIRKWAMKYEVPQNVNFRRRHPTPLSDMSEKDESNCISVNEEDIEELPKTLNDVEHHHELKFVSSPYQNVAPFYSNT